MPPKKGNRRRNKSKQRNAASKRAVVQFVQQPAARKGRRRNRRANPSKSVALSDCAYTYARAIGDPWSQDALGACIPMPAGLTQKVTGFFRVSAQVGTQGIGFAAMMPSVASDMPHVYLTTGNYLLNTISPVSAGVLSAGVLAATCPNLPYNSGQLIDTLVVGATNLNARIVASGGRLWYSGKTINMSGTSFQFRDPFHGSIQSDKAGNVATLGYYGSRRECTITHFDRTARSVADFAYHTPEQDMSSYVVAQNQSFNAAVAATRVLYPFSAGEKVLSDPAGGTTFLTTAFDVGIPTSIIAFTGTPGETFEFEYIIHVEYGGTAVAAVGTSTLADPVGAARVLDAAAMAQTANQQPDGPTLWERLTNALSSIQQAVAPHQHMMTPALFRMGQIFARSKFAERGGLEYKE